MTQPLSPFQQQLTIEKANSATAPTCGAVFDIYTCFRPPHAPEVAHAGTQPDGSFVQWA